jgi:ACS family 4-hydroxyphenylacetate permease-like MFS transporter
MDAVNGAQNAAALTVEEERVVRRVFTRLSWFLFLLCIAMSLDRTNIGFAALQMNKALGLTATEFGFTITIFSIGYILSEIPSNVMMARVGAKIWLPRIAVTWGLATTAMMLAAGPKSLFTMRFVLGLAEGGFLPGTLLYLSWWLPEVYRARAMGLFLLAQPVAFVVTPVISGALLQFNGTLGLAGWRWLFLLEGLPSIALGLFAYWYLNDRPRNASWLSVSEKSLLEGAIERQETARQPKNGKRFAEYRSATMVLLALTYFGIPVSLANYVAWTPQIIHAALGSTGSYFLTGLIAALLPSLSVIVMPWWSARSDRLQERTWHAIIPLGGAAFGWLLSIWAGNPIVALIGLACAIICTFTAQAIFFTFATARLSLTARPVGLGMISATGVLGASLSPLWTGFFKDVTGSLSIGLEITVAMLLLSIVTLVWVSRRPIQPVAAALEMV